MTTQWVRSALGLALVLALVVVPLSACHADDGKKEQQQGAVASDDSTSADMTKESKVIKDGSRVSIEYTLTLSDGSVVDTNVGKDPLVYTQGGGQLLPALEAQLVGLKVSDTKNVHLSAAQGYGEIDPKAYQEVDVDQIPEEARKVGTLLVARGSNGKQRPIRVHEVRKDKIVLDFNHPLAGKALVFDVTVVGIK